MNPYFKSGILKFQLNPFSDDMYNVLKEIFDEYQDIFDYDSFHVGGDEVSLVFYFTRHLDESYYLR